MALGTDIGDAFIDVHARTGPFRRELRRDARRAANDASNQMENNFDPDFGAVGNRLRRQMRGFGTLSGEDFTDAVQKVLDDRSGKIAQRFAEALATGDFSRFTEQFDDMDVAVRRFNAAIDRLNRSGALARGEYQAVNRAFRDYRRTLDNAARDSANLEFNQNRLRTSNERLRDIQMDLNALSRADNVAAREAEAASRARLRASNDRLRSIQSEITGLAELEQSNDRARRAASELADEFGRSLPGVIEELRRTDFRFERLTRNVVRNSERIRGVLRSALRVDDDDESAIRAIDVAVERLGEASQSASTEVDRLNRGLGRLRGSRNNFLNLVGAIDQAIRRGTFRSLERLTGGIGEGLQRMGQRMIGVRGIVGEFGALFVGVGDRVQRLGTSLDGLIVQVILGVAAFNVFLGILGPLTALISGLSGAFVALTVSVGGALLGGILQLGPGLLAVAAGAGAAALAFSDLSDKQKEAFEPFSDWASEARSVVQEELFANITDQVNGLTDVLSGQLTPLLRDSAAVMREVGDQFVAGIQSPEFTASLETLQTFLPQILEDLLLTVGNLGEGLINLFAAASPQAAEFFESLNGIVERFNEWTASEEGRQAINDFLTDANSLLSSIWDLITEVSETFSIFWEEGNEFGQQLIDKLAQIVENFNDWLNTEAGRAELRGWFEDAVTIIEEVGDVLDEAGRLIDELDSPTNRATLLFLLNSFETIISAIADIVGWAEDAKEAITGIRDGGVSLQEIQDLLNTLQDTFEDVVDVVGRVAGAIVDAFDISLFGEGQGIVQGLIDGINSREGSLIGTAIVIASRVSSAFASVLGIFSPSRVFRDYGRDITDGLVLGMEAGQGAVQDAAANLINTDALGNLNTPLSRLGQQGAPQTAAAAAPISAGNITIVTPYADPRLVALETMDALAAQGR